MVTGASGPVGHALVPILVGRDEVRAVVRRPEAAEPLRLLGAKVAVGRLDDVEALAEVLRRVYTVIHLVGGPDQPDEHALWDANHGSVVRAVAAAELAGVRRFVLVSVPGASPDSPEPYLRARGLAEEAVTTSRLDHAVIRSTHVVGAGCPWFTTMVAGAASSPPLVLGRGDQLLAPVALEDLAATLAAADDLDGDLSGTWGLEGPDVVTADEMVALLTGPDGPVPHHVDEADAPVTIERLLGMRIVPEAAALFCRSSRADAPSAAQAFGVVGTPLAASIRRTLEGLPRGASPDEPG